MEEFEKSLDNNYIKPAKPKEIAKKLGLTSERFYEKEMSENAFYYIEKAKKKHRSDWDKYQYYKTDWCQKLLENCPDQIDRVHCKDLTLEQFKELYEIPDKPLIIQGLTKNWNTHKYWAFEEIYQRYKDVDFKIGEDDEGYKIRTKLKYFFEYIVHQKDDSPLYLFESAVEDIEKAKNMVGHYVVPPYFTDDLFALMGEKKRPPYRWFLIGPERSGTTVHQDPLMTSAWNTSLQGHKRWVLFPKNIPKSIVKGKEFLKEYGEDNEAIMYFAKILPRIKQKEGKNLKIIEFIQNPGDTVFVPGGWWHAVVNLDNTMAVTQNFTSRINFNKVWRSVRSERKRFAEKFLEKLQKNFVQLYEIAIQLNKDDNFLMLSEQKPLLQKRKHSQDQEQNEFLEDNNNNFKIEKKFKVDTSPSHSGSSDSSSSSSSPSSSSSSNSTSSRSQSPS